MNKCSLTIASLIGVLLMSMAGSAQAEKLYRWVDEDGNVHYSDKIPPEAVDQERTQLNEQGVAVDQVDRALTAEELAAEAERKRIEDEEQRRRAEQREADERIVRAFTGEDDIARLRDSKIEAIRRNIELTESTLDVQRKRMTSLRERAADYERAGEDVPANLVSEIDSLGKRIEEQRQFLNRRHEEMAQVQEDYMSQLEQFRGARERLGYDEG